MTEIHPAVVAMGSVRTSDVQPSDRLEFWESYNATVLIGVRCTSYAAGGLSAEESNFDVGGIKLADIRGNAHVVERTPELTRLHPKESVFASLMIEGSALFYSADSCIPVHAGDVIVYDTTHPYLFAFGSTMRQILIDVPRDLLAERFGTARFHRPVVADPRVRGARALVDLLTDARGPDRGPVECTSETLLDAVGGVSGLSGDLGAARVQQARNFVETALGDPDLTAEHVARAVGVTLRHLNRAFADAGMSVSRLIRERRLDRAVEDLESSTHASIADIANKWGFGSHAQFANAVRHRYGLTPSALRQRNQPCHH